MPNPIKYQTRKGRKKKSKMRSIKRRRKSKTKRIRYKRLVGGFEDIFDYERAYDNNKLTFFQLPEWKQFVKEFVNNFGKLCVNKKLCEFPFQCYTQIIKMVQDTYYQIGKLEQYYANLIKNSDETLIKSLTFLHECIKLLLTKKNYPILEKVFVIDTIINGEDGKNESIKKQLGLGLLIIYRLLDDIARNDEYYTTILEKGKLLENKYVLTK